MKEKAKQEKGVTLIALVITIIVLLILAAVSIAMLTGENGILTQANNAKVEQSHGSVTEGISLAYNEYQIEINTSSNVKIASTETVTIQGKEEKALAQYSSFLDFLVQKRYATRESATTGIINVEELTGSKQALGNGEETDTDVYKIEEEDGSYIVNYYNENNQKEELWNVADDETTQESSRYRVENIAAFVVGLKDVETDSYTTFSNAYIVYNGQTIDVSDVIVDEEGISEVYIVDIRTIVYNLTSEYLEGGTYDFTIVKDGQEYHGEIEIPRPV